MQSPDRVVPLVLGRVGGLNEVASTKGLGYHDACFGQPAIDGLEQ